MFIRNTRLKFWTDIFAIQFNSILLIANYLEYRLITGLLEIAHHETEASTKLSPLKLGVVQAFVEFINKDNCSSCNQSNLNTGH